MMVRPRCVGARLGVPFGDSPVVIPARVFPIFNRFARSQLISDALRGHEDRKRADPRGDLSALPYSIAFEKHEQQVLIRVSRSSPSLPSLRTPSRSPRRQRGTFETVENLRQEWSRSRNVIS